MKSKAFVDTNVVVYAHDRSSLQKRDIGRDLIARLIAASCGVISTQVLQEFYIAATKKLRIAPELSKNILEALNTLEIVTINPLIIMKSIDSHVHWHISFWDALIIESAIFSQCSILYTEDLNHNQKYGTVTVINPFRADFEIL